jgi:hypothetical protein
MTETVHGPVTEIALDKDPYRGYATKQAMRDKLIAAGVDIPDGQENWRADMAALLDRAGLSLCRSVTHSGGLERPRRLRCQLYLGHEGQCGYYRQGGQGGSWTRWWGANPRPPAPEPWMPPQPYRDLLAARDRVIAVLRHHLCETVHLAYGYAAKYKREARYNEAYATGRALEVILRELGDPGDRSLPKPDGALPLAGGAEDEARRFLGVTADTLLGKQVVQ